MFFSPSTILEHLKVYLPGLTNLFSTNVDVNAEIIAGTPQILRITKSGHTYDAGDEIITVNGLIDNPITAVQDFEENGNIILRFTTNLQHDLTLTEGAQIELSGFTDSAFNGFHELYSVPNRNKFEIIAGSIPTLTGSEVLRESWNNGINGKFIIDSVAPNTIDILLTDKPIFNTGAIPQLQVVDEFRMSVSADFERAQEIYTEQQTDSDWLFVIMNNCTMSKDRNIISDATATNTKQNPQRLKLINRFFIYTILPTTEDLAAAEASQKCWTDIYFYILASLAGYEFESFGNSNYLTNLINHGTAIYNKGYYGHIYEFEFVYEILDLQTFTQQFITDRAFRDSFLSFAEIQDGSEINLDDES